MKWTWTWGTRLLLHLLLLHPLPFWWAALGLMFSLHARWWLVSVQWENIGINVACWHQIGFLFFSFFTDIALAAFHSNKLIGGPMFNGAAAHPFQNNHIGESLVLSRDMHHASSCLDQAHMGFMFYHTVSCILLFF